VQAHKERMMTTRENNSLRQQIKGLEKELARKDGVIKQLLNEHSAVLAKDIDNPLSQIPQTY
jgi:hypothetical protein